MTNSSKDKGTGMYRKSILENGIRVITESMPSVRSVAMGIVVDTGLRDEEPGKGGQAHMVEHLMFQGTSNRDSLQIARLMDEAGGRIGGFTTRDYTCYAATVLDDYRTYALELLGDILLNSRFLPGDIEKEKETILREIDAQFDMPDNRVDTLLKAHTWNGHPLGMPVTGIPETISSLTRDDVVNFVDTHYLPQRLIIAAAGNIEHHDFVAQVQDAFWPMLGNPKPACGRPLEYHSGVAVAHMPVTQAYFSIGLKAHPFAHPDRYGLHIFNKILGDGISSRLFRRIREDQGLVYEIGSHYHAYRDGGLMVIDGSTKPECFQRVLAQTLDVLSQLVIGHDPVQSEELVRAKNQIKGQHLIASEDTNTRMSRLATQELYFGQYISMEDIVAQIEKIDVQYLKDITQKSLIQNLDKISVAVVGPKSSWRYDDLAKETLQANLNRYQRN
jgi:predicted Zn-dependent peptidase